MFRVLLCALSLMVGGPARVAAASGKSYRNPLLPSHRLADPHVIRVGGKYYLYVSEHGMGVEVYVSTDLVNWRLQPEQAFKDPRGGVWAPDVFHHARGDGRFYLYYTDTMANRVAGRSPKQIGVAVAEKPTGPFTDTGVLARTAIDAHLFGDDDGKLYLYYVDRSAGLFQIVVQPMSDPVTKHGGKNEVIRPTEPWEKRGDLEVTEGPFMLKRHGTYYLMYSGSAAHSPHYAIGYATADSPLGPFTKHAGNPIGRGTDKIISPGHHSVVEGPDKALWMAYHQKRGRERGFDRFMAIDPLWFDDAGVIYVRLSRDTDQPAP